MSHSTRVRGLKFPLGTFQRLAVSVALYTSAWIEMNGKPSMKNNSNASHSTRVRGLKSIEYAERKQDLVVALYTSAWIEILI